MLSRLFILILIISGWSYSQASDGNNFFPLITHTESKDSAGHPFLSTEAVVSGDEALDAVPPFLEAYEKEKGPKSLVISSDDPNAPLIKKLDVYLKPVADAPHFLLLDEGSALNPTEKVAGFIKENKEGVIMATFSSIMGSIFYLHFSTHNEILPMSVVIMINTIQQFLFTSKASAWLPNLKRGSRNWILNQIGIREDESFEAGPYIRKYLLSYVGWSLLYSSLTGLHSVHGGWQILTFESYAAFQGLVSTLAVAPYNAVARKFLHPDDPLLSRKSIDIMLGLRNMALSMFLPWAFLGHWEGLVATGGVAAVGWAILWKGDQVIPFLKSLGGVKQAVAVADELRALVIQEALKDESKEQSPRVRLKNTIALCGKFMEAKLNKRSRVFSRP